MRTVMYGLTALAWHPFGLCYDGIRCLDAPSLLPCRCRCRWHGGWHASFPAGCLAQEGSMLASACSKHFDLGGWLAGCTVVQAGWRKACLI